MIDNNYEDFLQTKVKSYDYEGFEASQVNSNLFPEQEFVVKISLKKGRFGIYADTGRGKTIMQLSTSDAICKEYKMPCILLCPLSIIEQTIEEGRKFGIECKKLDPKQTEFDNVTYIINYEQLKNIENSECFKAVLLDESSILKGYTSKTRLLLNEVFKNSDFRFCYSATPSPNDLVELVNQAQFLGVIESNSDALQRWFMPDQSAMGNYSLKPHAIKDFWRWVASWCVMFRLPSDLGFDDFGAGLPKVKYITHLIEKPVATLDDLKGAEKASATNLHKEIKATQKLRLNIAEKIIKGSDDAWLAWVLQNDDGDELERRLSGELFSESKTYEIEKDKRKIRQVAGKNSDDYKSKQLLSFAKSDYRVLITKPKIASMGLNFQAAHKMIFTAVDYSYEQLYQGIRRMARFGQKKEVEVHMIITEQQKGVLSSLKSKEAAHLEMLEMARMYMRAEYVEHDGVKIQMDYKKKDVSGLNFQLLQGDCVERIDDIKDNSIGMVMTSIPFAALYRYTENYRDMGNNATGAEFQRNLKFLTDKLYDKVMPGRICCIHVKDLAAYQHSSGYTGIIDFSGRTVQTFEESGFCLKGKITIWNEPKMEMIKTKTQRLLHSQLCKDSTMSSVSMPEYLLIFQKWSDKDGRTPVTGVSVEDKIKWTQFSGTLADRSLPNFDKLMKDSATRNGLCTLPEQGHYAWRQAKGGVKVIDMTIEEATKVYYNYWEYSVKEVKVAKERLLIQSIEIWQRQASPVWFDIDRSKTLETRLKKDEVKHICPFAIPIVERAVKMWSNEGDVILDPFNGIGTVGHVSINESRKYKGIELNEGYFKQAVKNLRNAEQVNNQQTLF